MMATTVMMAVLVVSVTTTQKTTTATQLSNCALGTLATMIVWDADGSEYAGLCVCVFLMVQCVSVGVLSQ